MRTWGSGSRSIDCAVWRRRDSPTDGVGSTSVARTQYPGGSRPGSRAVRPLCKVKRRLTGQLLGACSGDETFHYRVLPAAARFCPLWPTTSRTSRSEEHTSELQSQSNLVCRLLLEKKKALISLHRMSNAPTPSPVIMRSGTITRCRDHRPHSVTSHLCSTDHTSIPHACVRHLLHHI